ncbi:enoyl-CoA hydratase [Hoeflea sp. BAL378]|uniref:crotonase/enoyl-CoA hydratase family protein n=1 Tax=Hoeflea sp. BAL378 TaxID=1547437 RepID=UPI000513E79B|nr:crotonase/enoyl-CoA hydratase family protein [Hoeflea sp. BAL378]KGF70726.1 enoyl-CoA hydratase [Hoeflea sp. BAL378]
MQEVLFEVEDGVAIITINRPEAKNAVTRAVSQGISDALDEVDSRNDIRIAIITGAGGTFCAGMDLKAFLRGEIVGLEGSGFGGIARRVMTKPVIAAVEGYAVGGGFEIALACSMIVAATDAKFALPEVKRGLAPTAGGLVRLPRLLPPRIATEMVLTGDTVTAADLERHGLVNKLAEPGGALAAAKQLAARVAANGPLAIKACAQVMREQQDWTTDEVFARQAKITDVVFASADAREGATAFAEKRKPNWQGK